MILYFGNVRLIDGKPVGEAITAKIELIAETHFYIISNKNRFTRLLSSLWAFIKWGRKSEMVHIASYSTASFYYSIYIAILSRLFRLPYMVVVHGGDYPKRLKRSPRLCRFLFLNSTCNITPSHYLEHHLQQNNIKVQCIPNFIDISGYAFKERPTIRPQLLWVRSFHQIYNAPMAAEVLAILIQQYPEATLTMVGGDKDGSLNAFQNRCKELRIQDRVTIKGFMKREEWVKLAIDHDVFINTTTIDNTPMSVIEAMALGIPVVSTNVGGIPFLLKHKVDALLVESNNAQLMSDAIHELMHNNQLAQSIIKNAHEKSLSFTWEAVKQDWITVFNKILKRTQ